MKKLPILFALMLISLASFAQEGKTDVKADFLAMLDGTEEAAQLAVKTYCDDEVIANGMLPFGAKPVVTATEANCVWFTLTDDGEANQYYICSEGNKITEFDWNWDDEEEEE